MKLLTWYIALHNGPTHTHGRGFPHEAATYEAALAHAEKEAARDGLVVDYIEPWDQGKSDSLSEIQQQIALRGD
jgi:hypothetical protein